MGLLFQLLMNQCAPATRLSCPQPFGLMEHKSCKSEVCFQVIVLVRWCQKFTVQIILRWNWIRAPIFTSCPANTEKTVKIQNRLKFVSFATWVTCAFILTWMSYLAWFTALYVYLVTANLIVLGLNEFTKDLFLTHWTCCRGCVPIFSSIWLLGLLHEVP